jgi:hypothetical protein
MNLTGEEEGGEAVSEDLRIAQDTLKASTMKVVRQFSKPENRAKLNQFRAEILGNKGGDSDLAEFNQTWKVLGDLVNYWLTTPEEEVKSNLEQKEKLSVEVDTLKKKADAAKDDYKK